MKDAVLELRGVTKEFSAAGRILHILRGVQLSVRAGESLAIQGPSGSGKSTLLGLMAGLERPSSGDILYRGESLTNWDEEKIAHWRRTSVGFIFQNFRLVESLTALENVMLPLEIRGDDEARAREEAAGALDALGIKDRAEHFPNQLSGGEQQRVAIARAYAHKPAVIFADEPTGSLDRETASSVMESLLSIRAGATTALILVTHDPDVAAKLDRTLILERGAFA